MATDLIAITGPYSLVERSAATFTAKFRDTAASAYVTPTNAYWRIDNEDGCQVADWTALTIADSATSASVAVSADQNAIKNCAKDREQRALTVMTDRGLSTQFASTYLFDVRNLAWRS